MSPVASTMEENDEEFVDHSHNNVSFDDLNFILGELEKRRGDEGPSGLHGQASSSKTQGSSEAVTGPVDSEANNDLDSITHNQSPGGTCSASTSYHIDKNHDRPPCDVPNQFEDDQNQGLASTAAHEVGNKSAGPKCCICGKTEYVSLRCYNISLCANCRYFINAAAEKSYFYRCFAAKPNECDLTFSPATKKKMCKGCRLQKIIRTPGFDQGLWLKRRMEASRKADSSSLTPGDSIDVPGKRENISCCICRNPYRVALHYGIEICVNCHLFINYASKHSTIYPCSFGLYKCITFYKHKYICKGCRLKKAFQMGLQEPRLLALDRSAYPMPQGDDEHQMDTQDETEGQQSTIESFRCIVCRNPNHPYRFHGYMVCMNCAKFAFRVIKRGVLHRCLSGGCCNIEWQPDSRSLCQGCRMQKLFNLPNLSSLTRTDASGANQSSSAVATHISESTSIDSREMFSSGPSQAKTVNRACVICSNTMYISRRLQLGDMCSACYQFLKKSIDLKLVHKCINGDNNCDIVHMPFRQAQLNPLCKGCRLSKALRLGMEHPCLPQQLQPQQQPSQPTNREQPIPRISDGSASQRSINLLLTAENNELLNQAPEMVKRFSTDDNIELERSNSSTTILASDQEEGHKENDSSDTLDGDYEDYHDEDNDGATIIRDDGDSRSFCELPVSLMSRLKVYRADELEVPNDEFGLPLDVETRFSRWLYNDFNSFMPNSRTTKSLEEAVEPPENSKNNFVMISNEVINPGIDLLTQDLSPEEELLPIAEVLTSILKIKPSESLKATKEQSGMPMMDKPSKKLKLTLKLKTLRTVIDRRPMLKRLKASNGATFRRFLLDTPNEVSTTSLIAPDEDCDGSDDDDIPEIDCDKLATA